MRAKEVVAWGQTTAQLSGCASATGRLSVRSCPPSLPIDARSHDSCVFRSVRDLLHRLYMSSTSRAPLALRRRVRRNQSRVSMKTSRVRSGTKSSVSSYRGTVPPAPAPRALPLPRCSRSGRLREIQSKQMPCRSSCFSIIRRHSALVCIWPTNRATPTYVAYITRWGWCLSSLGLAVGQATLMSESGVSSLELRSCTTVG